MKILYTNGTLRNHNDPAIERIRNIGHAVDYYDSIIDPHMKNLIEIRHFQMYEDILDLVEKENYDLLYFSCPIGVPEYFLSELKTRSNLKTKIISHSSFREINRSLARSLILSELVSMKQFAKMVFVSFFVEDGIYPENFTKANFNFKKLIFFNEPFGMGDKVEAFNISKEKSRKALSLNQKDFICLLFGSWKYTKGVDIFVDALKYLDEDITVIIQKHNFNFERDGTLSENLKEEAIKNHKKTIFINEYISQENFAKLCISSDVIISAHRKLYEYSFTGIPCNAALAKRLLIAPNFFPFNEIIKRFKIGVTYTPECSSDLATAIHSVRKYYDELILQAKFEESLKSYRDESDFQPEVIKQYTKEVYENNLL